MRPTLALASLAILSLAACTTVDTLTDRRVGQATLSTANGLPAGTAQLLRTGETLSLTVAVAGLPAGSHGYHIHTTGSCGGTAFAAAGGHLNPGDRKHGTKADGGPHLGDLPNLSIAANRTGSVTVDLPGDADTLLSQIFDTDGAALVVHESADDYLTDPSGNSGARIACGVLSRVAQD